MDINRKAASQINNQPCAIAEELESLKKEYEKFMYLVSHDLAAPLRHIQQFSSLLLNSLDAELDKKQQVFVSHINGSVERCQGMLDGLLMLSRVDTVERTIASTDINRLIQRTVELRFSDKNADIVHLSLGSVPPVFTDRHELESVLLNIIDNAIKFQRPEVALNIKVTTTQEGRFVQVRVEDNGIGIDQKHSESIFDVFKKLDQKQSDTGAGIGLTLSRKIVTKHGGKMWHEQAPGEGAVILFSLPIYQ